MSDEVRRDPSKTTGASGKAPPKKRDRSWDKAHRLEVAGYRIGVELKEEIRTLAADLGTSPAKVAKFFFKHCLEEYRAGRLTIDVNDD